MMKSFADWTQEMAESQNHEPENPFRPSAKVTHPPYAKCEDCKSTCRSVDGTWANGKFYCEECKPLYSPEYLSCLFTAVTTPGINILELPPPNTTKDGLTNGSPRLIM